MKLKHIFAVAFIILLIASMLLWSLFDDPAPDIDEPTIPEKSTEQNIPNPTGKSSTNITVRTPLANDTVGQSFQVQGSARVFENVVSYRVLNPVSNTILASGVTTADAPDVGQFGNFTITITLPGSAQLQKDDPLVLEVFQASAKDGSDTDKVSVNLKFKAM